MFDFSNYSPTSKYYDDSNKLVVGNMKDQAAGIAIKEFFGLKLFLIYSFLIDENSEHKKGKGAKYNFTEKVGHSEYKDVLLIVEWLRHLNSIQSKNHKIATYENKKMSLPCFEEKIYILNKE